MGLLLGLATAGCSDRPTLADGTGDGTGDGTAGVTASDGADETTGAGACEWDPQPIPVQLDQQPAPECAHLVSEGEVTPVTLRIVNDGDEVVHLTSPLSCNPFRFLVQDAAGQPFPPAACTFACEDSLMEACGCLADCPLGRAIALHPGGVFETEWPGMTLRMEEASPECAGECAGACGVRVPPTPGPMQVTLALAQQLDCEVEGCPCEPGEEGWCEVPGWADGEATLVERAIEWPTPCPTIELSVP